MSSFKPILRSSVVLSASFLSLFCCAQMGFAAGNIIRDRESGDVAAPVKASLARHDFAAAVSYLESPSCSMDESSWLYWNARLIYEKQVGSAGVDIPSEKDLQELALAEDYVRASMRLSNAYPEKAALLKRIEARCHVSPAIALVR